MTLDIADYKTESWTVSKSIEDALWVLQTQIDKQVVPAALETIQATASDHTDDAHTVFVGIIPAADYTLAAVANKAVLTGYDYAWYLTVQYVPEYLRTIAISQNPATTIAQLLGEDTTQTPAQEWAKNTGIEPYRLNNVTDWANIQKIFEFDDKCTRWKAIQEIADYCNYVFVVKWRDVVGSWRPCAYFVHEDVIDTAGVGIDIATQTTITEPDSHLLDGVTVKDNPEHQYNKVLTTGYDTTAQTYFYAEAKAAGVGDTILPVEYVHADASLTTQAKTEAKAQEILEFFQASAKVYVARFKKRMDLELYQKINFIGYNKVAIDDMRITRITYSRSKANDVVEIEFMKDQAIQQLRRLSRAVSPDYVSGGQDLVGDRLSEIGLVNVFNDPVSEGGIDGLWELHDGYARLIDNNPIDAGGWLVDNCTGLRGADSSNVSLWGWSDTAWTQIEFLKWLTSGEIRLAGNLNLDGNDITEIGSLQGAEGLDFILYGSKYTDDEVIEFMRWDKSEHEILFAYDLRLASGIDIEHDSTFQVKAVNNIGLLVGGAQQMWMDGDKVLISAPDGLRMQHNPVSQPDYIGFRIKSSAPTPTYKEGILYYDNSDNTLRYHDGSNWKTIATV